MKRSGAIELNYDAFDRERRWIEFQMNQKCEAKKWKEEFAKKKRRMSMLFHRSIKRRITNALEGRISLAHIVHSVVRKRHHQMIGPRMRI